MPLVSTISIGGIAPVMGTGKLIFFQTLSATKVNALMVRKGKISCDIEDPEPRNGDGRHGWGVYLF